MVNQLAIVSDGSLRSHLSEFLTLLDSDPRKDWKREAAASRNSVEWLETAGQAFEDWRRRVFSRLRSLALRYERMGDHAKADALRALEKPREIERRYLTVEEIEQYRKRHPYWSAHLDQKLSELKSDPQAHLRELELSLAKLRGRDDVEARTRRDILRAEIEEERKEPRVFVLPVFECEDVVRARIRREIELLLGELLDEEVALGAPPPAEHARERGRGGTQKARMCRKRRVSPPRPPDRHQPGDGIRILADDRVEVRVRGQSHSSLGPVRQQLCDLLTCLGEARLAGTYFVSRGNRRKPADEPGTFNVTEAYSDLKGMLASLSLAVNDVIEERRRHGGIALRIDLLQPQA